jgi:hypothetical protein
MVGEKYIEAIAVGANALPVLVPALGPELDCCSPGAHRTSNPIITEDRRVSRERYMIQIGMLRRFR